jgi:hypothetical protein
MTGQDRDVAALDAIEELLETYGKARYSPPGPVLSRIRANVVAEARAAAAAAAASRRLPAADLGDPSRWTIGRLRLPVFQVHRRAVALGMAAALTLGTSAAVLAAPPGSAFYNARVALEAVLLPNALDDRLAAHERHLRERLAEAEAAAGRHDPSGLQTALAAYQAEVDAALADVGDSADLLAHLEEMLGDHVVVLTALEASVPEQGSVDNALDASQKAIVKIRDREQGQRGGGKPSDPSGGPRTPSRDN